MLVKSRMGESFTDEYVYQSNLLEALIVVSTTEESFHFPTIEEFILSEVVNGVIEYCGGISGKVTYAKTGDSDGRFERLLHDFFKEEMKKSSQTLNTKVNDAITAIVQPYSVHAPPERPYLHTKLYGYWNGFGCGICPVVMKSTFSLPQELIVTVKKNVLPAFSDDERKDVEGIAKAMRKYVDEDIAFIQKRYHW